MAPQHPQHWSATWQLIREDLKTHGHHSRSGFRALAVHRFGEWAFARKSAWQRALLRKVYWFFQRYVTNHLGIEIMRGAMMGRRISFPHQGGIVIHGASRIDDDCIIRHNVTLGARSRKHSNTAPHLKPKVEVGVGAVIIGDVCIGEQAILGANVVVSEDVPARAIVKPAPCSTILRD